MKFPVKIILINLVGLLMIFGLFEGICRVAGIPYKVGYVPNENKFARFDPDAGWSYIPNTSTLHKTGDVTVPVYFDENGARVPGPDFHFDFSKPSVLFIGGSITMGHGLPYKDTFVGKFASMRGNPYQAVNLGVQGYGTDQSLITLKKFLPRFNTKVVVYDFSEDVVKRNGNYDRRMLIPTAKFLGTKPLFALDSKGNLYLQKKPKRYEDYIDSYLLDLIKIKVGTLSGTFPPFPEELTKKLIMEMKRVSNGYGARFVVIDWRWTDHDYDRLLKDLDVDIIDTLEDAPEGWEKMVLFGGSHPDAQASDHVARLIWKYFNQKGLLTDGTESGTERLLSKIE